MQESGSCKGQGKKENHNPFFQTLRSKCKLKNLDKFGQEKKHHSLKKEIEAVILKQRKQN